MDSSIDTRTEVLMENLGDFIAHHALPADSQFHAQLDASEDRWEWDALPSLVEPKTVQWILDKAIQVHGRGGLSQDLPLAYGYAGVRTLRFADAPDEVHLNALARNEFKGQAARRAALEQVPAQ